MNFLLVVVKRPWDAKRPDYDAKRRGDGESRTRVQKAFNKPSTYIVVLLFVGDKILGKRNFYRLAELLWNFNIRRY